MKSLQRVKGSIMKVSDIWTTIYSFILVLLGVTFGTMIFIAFSSVFTPIVTVAIFLTVFLMIGVAI